MATVAFPLQNGLIEHLFSMFNRIFLMIPINRLYLVDNRPRGSWSGSSNTAAIWTYQSLQEQIGWSRYGAQRNPICQTVHTSRNNIFDLYINEIYSWQRATLGYPWSYTILIWHFNLGNLELKADTVWALYCKRCLVIMGYKYLHTGQRDETNKGRKDKDAELCHEQSVSFPS